MEWALNNLPETLLIIGIALLVIEVAVLGFSTFVLFFVGCAALLTGILLFFGFLPETMLSALLSVGIITAISAALLWKPLKAMQSNVDTHKAKGDLVGHRFVLAQDIKPGEMPEYKYSGITWCLISEEHLAAGTKVQVTEAEVGKFHIKAVVP